MTHLKGTHFNTVFQILSNPVKALDDGSQILSNLVKSPSDGLTSHQILSNPINLYQKTSGLRPGFFL